MNENWRELLALVPQAPDWRTDWERLSETRLSRYFRQMAVTQQNPVWHSEGDVWTHTRMVCEELAADRGFRELSLQNRQMVFLAALLHDIGKIPCTKWEDGRWTSPNHTITGAKMAREILWREYGVCGTKELQTFRECVCTLIHCHSVPSHVLDQKNPEFRLLKIAAQGELIPGFSLELLRVLVEADMKGRISSTRQESLDTVGLCFEFAKEIGAADGPGYFASEAVKRAYFSGRKVWREQELYDDVWGEVILMAGLPGTGKDTWIREHYAGMPVVSLDEIRRVRKISPKDEQGAVVNAAREQARQYLRKKQPFVWNATSLSLMIRRKQISLFESYHAAVRIVFLETGWEDELARNRARDSVVSEEVIGRMLRQLEPPERYEARSVEWHCV